MGRGHMLLIHLADRESLAAAIRIGMRRRSRKCMCIADRQTREKPTVQEKRRKRYQMRVTRREAVQHVNISEVDLMITDLIMPEQEGLETIEILHRRRPDLKIIAISGKFGGQFLRVAKLFGAQATLTKPVLPDQLLEAVRQVLGSSL